MFGLIFTKVFCVSGTEVEAMNDYSSHLLDIIVFTSCFVLDKVHFHSNRRYLTRKGFVFNI